MTDDDLAAEGCGMGSAALALFGAGAVVGLLVTPVRGLLHTLVHAFWHPGCLH